MTLTTISTTYSRIVSWSRASVGVVVELTEPNARAPTGGSATVTPATPSIAARREFRRPAAWCSMPGPPDLGHDVSYVRVVDV